MGVKNALESRVLKIFQPCEPNDNGLAQRACSLCKGHKGTGGTQLETAKSKMHGHLALQCEYLASSQDPKDQEFLLELRKRCPRSVATSKRSREILREAQGDQEDDLHGATAPKKPRGKKAKEQQAQAQMQAEAMAQAQAMQAQALQQAQAAQIQVQAQLNQLTAQQNMQQALNQANQVNPGGVNQLGGQLPPQPQMSQQPQLGMAPQHMQGQGQVPANTWAAWQRTAAQAAGLQAGLYSDNRAWWGMDGLGAAAHSAAALHGALQQQHLQQLQPGFAPEAEDEAPQKRGARGSRGRGRGR